MPAMSFGYSISESSTAVFRATSTTEMSSMPA